MGGIFLRIPAVQCTSSRTSPAPISEVSVESHDASALQETNGFSAEIKWLEHVLSSVEQELVKTWMQLLEVQEEVTCLRIRNSEYSSKLLEVQGELELERERVAELARENTSRRRLREDGIKSLNFGTLTVNSC